MAKPNFFIVGAPKCGTTAMHEYLAQHPEVFMPAEKEPHFFCDDLRPPGFRPDRDAYMALFADSGDRPRVGESSTWYLFSTAAAERIKQFAPDAAIIVMLRNPVDMLYSLHSQMVFNGDPLPNFAEAIATEDPRLDRYEQSVDHRAAKGLRLRNVFHSRCAHYAEQLRRYFDAFGADRVHVIIYDDFRADAAATYRHTLDFLGIDPQFRPDFRIYNANKTVRSPRLRSLMQATPLWLRKAVDAVAGYRTRKRLSLKLKALNATNEPRTPMDQALRAQLQQRFAPQVRDLSTLVGRDLTGWCTPDNTD